MSQGTRPASGKVSVPALGAWRLAPPVDASALEAELRRSVAGEVRFDAGSKALYTVDGSNYRQVPIGVVIPKSIEDVIQAVAACRKFSAPILSRGGGTSLAGQCCNVAVVIDWVKYLHNILEINPEENYARVQPGVICDQLRQATAIHNLTWGPDPATHSHCTFGGMLGNNSCGVHSQMSGKAVDNTESMDILLYDGTRMTVGWMDDRQMEDAGRRGGRVGEIYASLKSLRERYAELIRKKFPQIPRRVSGYNLDELLPGRDGRFNVARALVGSESTCATILEAKVKLVPGHLQRVLVTLGYEDVCQAGDQVAEILPFEPIGLEGFDDVLTGNIAKKGLPQREYLQFLPEGNGWLMVEFGADKKEDAVDRARDFIAALNKKPNPPNMRMFVDSAEQKKIWSIRELALGANSFVPCEPHAWEGWEDSAVPPAKMGAYLRDLLPLYAKYDYKSALYGHFGQGCVHCRVTFDLETAAGIQKFRAFMEEATDLVVRYGGSFSGEHGDGQSRAEFLHKMFGPQLMEAFREFKSIWDPDWKMNPGKIVDPYRIDENLRLGAGYTAPKTQTHFDFSQDHGSFAQATLRCVGVGKCRRWSGEGEQDTMCPSYMVTREEKHSTRGRAHLLWEMLHGDVIKDGWRDEGVKEALDLCLSCKGCKGDCPVNVDVATYKAEFLSHYWEGKLRPLHAYAFGRIDKWARIASYAPGVANLLTHSPGLSAFSRSLLHVAKERALPAFASQTFKKWFQRREVRNQEKPGVLLWADTFNNYFRPDTAKAAVEVLEAAGFKVQVLQSHLCCGRPLYDHGFLDKARSYLETVLVALVEFIKTATPIVVLEPSCCSVFRDELTEMLPSRADARQLREQTFTLAEFLEQNASACEFPQLRQKAIVQAHCHHKAIMRFDQERSVMEKVGLDYRVLESGCCGMAGAFGYEKDKYEVSVACGERVLLPEVRQVPEDTIIVADGFSCREQIEQQTGRSTLHLAEVLKLAINARLDQREA